MKQVWLVVVPHCVKECGVVCVEASGLDRHVGRVHFRRTESVFPNIRHHVIPCGVEEPGVGRLMLRKR